MEGGTGRERIRVSGYSIPRFTVRMNGWSTSRNTGGITAASTAVSTKMRPFYNDDWMWDTYWNLHALGILLDPARKADELQSYARIYEQ